MTDVTVKESFTESGTLAVLSMFGLLIIVLGGLWLLGAGARQTVNAQTATPYQTTVPSFTPAIETPTSASLPASGAWAIDYMTDKDTGYRHKAAYIIHEEGYRFAIYRLVGKVYATFMLPTWSTDTINEHLPLLRVDRQEIIDFSSLEPVGLVLELFTGVVPFFQQPNGVTIHVNDGTSTPVPTDILYQLMHGNKLRVTYTTPYNQVRNIDFGLQGSNGTIQQILNEN